MNRIRKWLTTAKDRTVFNIQRKLKQIQLFFVRLAQLVVKTIAFVFNPLTWFIVAITMVGLAVWSGLQVFGPMTFTDEQNFALFEPPVIELFDTEQARDKAMSLYFSAQGLNSDVGIYLAQYTKGRAFREANQDIVGCNSVCLLERYEKGELNDLALGPFHLKREALHDLLKRSVATNREWYTSSIQLEIMARYLRVQAEQDGSALQTEGRLTDTIKEINQFIGHSISEQELQHIKEYFASEDVLATKRTARVFVSGFGKGNCKGRTDGGGAGCSSTLGSIDASNLILFLEAYASPVKISTPDMDGSGHATPMMIAGKKKAYEVSGGIDPAPNLYSSCDRLVATALRATGIDKNYPWGAVPHQVDYMLDSENWQPLPDPRMRESGDIITWSTDGGHYQHIAVYGINAEGSQMVYQASYYDYLPYKSKTNDANMNPNYDDRNVTYWRFTGKVQ